MTVCWTSLIIPAAVLAPNLLFLVFPPKNIKPQGESDAVELLLTICERLGQLGVFLLPLFYRINLCSNINQLVAALMMVSLAVYYVGWGRFYLNKRDVRFLFEPLWRLPIPMAISPVVYFLLAAKLLDSLPLLIAVSFLALGRLPLSNRAYKRTAG